MLNSAAIMDLKRLTDKRIVEVVCLIVVFITQRNFSIEELSLKPVVQKTPNQSGSDSVALG